MEKNGAGERRRRRHLSLRVACSATARATRKPKNVASSGAAPSRAASAKRIVIATMRPNVSAEGPSQPSPAKQRHGSAQRSQNRRAQRRIAAEGHRQCERCDRTEVLHGSFAVHPLPSERASGRQAGDEKAERPEDTGIRTAGRASARRKCRSGSASQWSSRARRSLPGSGRATARPRAASARAVLALS